MDNTIMRTMLFDFFGELLTEKQREYYDLHYNADLSLQEIAEQSGVSRQAVWDIIRRAQQSMDDYEAKTGLVARAVKMRRTVEEMGELISALPESSEKAALQTYLSQLD